ncbi:MAG: RodZ domain-containing protein [Acidimicrobiales bacterium]
MTLIVAIGLIVVIALLITWSRFGLGHSERRSMQNYGHALDVLGDVTKKSDAAVRARRFPNEARLDLKQDQLTAPATTPGEHATNARLEDVPVHFEDDSDAWEKAQEEAELETRVPRSAPSAPTPDLKAPVPVPELSEPLPEAYPPARRGLPWPRLGSAAAAVLIATGLAIAGLNLASTPSSRAGHGATLPKVSSHHHAVSPPTSTVPTTTVPSTLNPVSTSSTDVAFTAPSGAYTIAFADTGGTCWIGVQQTSGGAYVWQETLYSGERATYRASGPLVIRIGAPRFVGVKVDNVPARLPGYVQPYDVTFNPSTPPASA